MGVSDDASDLVGGFSITSPEYAFSGPERERQMAEILMELVNKYELELSPSR